MLLDASRRCDIDREDRLMAHAMVVGEFITSGIRAMIAVPISRLEIMHGYDGEGGS